MIVPIPSKYYAILTMTNRENFIIPVNPRTNRPAGCALVTISTSDEADRAISQLSNNEMLGRKVSIQRARAAEIENADSGTPTAEQRAFATSNERMEGSQGNRSIQAKEDFEESNTLNEVPKTKSNQGMYNFPARSSCYGPVEWLRDVF